MINTGLSSATIKILRTGDRYLGRGGDFVRCRTVDAAAAIKAANEINEEGVFLAWNEEMGDYLRVNRGTRAFNLICQMAS